MQQHLDWLARSFGRPDYEPLTENDLALIRHAGEVVSRQPGSHLFVEGEDADAVYVLERGEVEIYRGSGGARRVVAHGAQGAVLGDLAVFDGRPHLFSVRSTTHVRVLRMARARLLAELATHPRITVSWLVAGQRRLMQTQERVIELSHKTVLAQVADLLFEESAQQPEFGLSQGAIATLLGVSRQSVNEALGRLRDQGLVDTGYRSVRILDVAALERIASG